MQRDLKPAREQILANRRALLAMAVLFQLVDARSRALGILRGRAGYPRCDDPLA